MTILNPPRLAAFLLLCVSPLAAQDALDIVRRSVQLDQRNFLRFKDYTFQELTEERSLDGNGTVKSRKSETFDVTILYGRPFRRLIAKDGRALTSSEEKKEQAKLDKAVEEGQRENSKARRDWEKQRDERRKFLLEVPDAFDFRLLEEESVAGHPAYKIQATPKPAFKPKASDAKLLQKVRATLWIDKAQLQWVKVEAETIDTLSFGLFLARLAPGSRLYFEQTRINDGIWLPLRIELKGDARIALVRRLRGELEISYRNYRKFSTDSKIVNAEVH